MAVTYLDRRTCQADECTKGADIYNMKYHQSEMSKFVYKLNKNKLYKYLPCHKGGKAQQVLARALVFLNILQNQ